MSIIEQAAKRLEELRRAGVEIPHLGHGSHDGLMVESEEFDKTHRRGTPTAAVRLAKKSQHSVVNEDDTPPAPRTAVQSRRVDLDLARIAASGIITPDSPRSLLADEFRVIKRPLIANVMGKGAAPARNGNLIMVTSSLPAEGKSFTAVNLAMSIAMEMDHTVLLVDADVAKPSLPAILGLPPTPGLLDLLVDGSVDLTQVLLRSNVEKLSILPLGTQNPRATELLASDVMNRLLEEMASRYSDRIIIFDSPPLLVTTEARVLATHMGQIVVVVQAERTTQADVKHALATIESCPVKLMMLNKGRAASKSSYGYGDGYGYGYEYASR